MKRLFGELNGIVADGVSGHKDIMGFHWTRAFYNKLEAAQTGSAVEEIAESALKKYLERNENDVD